MVQKYRKAWHGKIYQGGRLRDSSWWLYVPFSKLLQDWVYGLEGLIYFLTLLGAFIGKQELKETIDGNQSATTDLSMPRRSSRAIHFLIYVCTINLHRGISECADCSCEKPFCRNPSVQMYSNAFACT